MSPAKRTKSARGTQSAKGTQGNGFTAEERAAMRERVKELKAQKNREEGERDVLAKIAEMEPSDRAMAEGVHGVMTDVAPDLAPRTWYGMPAYATADGKVLCFFRDARKFKTRYATFGFSDRAKLDEGAMWPTDFALMKWTADVEKRITALVKQALS